MPKALIATLAFLFSTSAVAALPAASEIPKDGDCPAGYSEKGKECIPGAQAKFAFLKSEICPENYEVQGNYCVAGANAKLAIRRAAMSCPSGFSPYGNYCVSEK